MVREEEEYREVTCAYYKQNQPGSTEPKSESREYSSDTEGMSVLLDVEEILLRRRLTMFK